MHSLEIISLYDKEGLKGFETGWGLSFWIEFIPVSRVILFDTGWNGNILLKNIQRVKKDIREVTDIFLTHDHWDHVGGVVFLLAYDLPNLKNIFVPSTFSTHFKQELKVLAHVTSISLSKNPIKLFPKGYSSGELGDAIKEQSLILRLRNEKTVLVTGCGHPQVSIIADMAAKVAPVSHLIGGFHDFKNIEYFSKIDNIIPVHCTKEKEKILKRFPEKTRTFKVGEKLYI